MVVEHSSRAMFSERIGREGEEGEVSFLMCKNIILKHGFIFLFIPKFLI